MSSPNNSPLADWLGGLTINLQMKLIVALVVLGFLVLGYKGVAGMNQMAGFVDNLYSQGMQHTIRAGKVLDRLGDARSQLLLAFQHAPDNEFSSMHGHPASLHSDNIRTALNELHSIIDNEILASPLGAEEEAQVQQMAAALDRVTQEGFEPALKRLEAGDYSGSNRILLQVINPQFSQVTAEAEKFLAMQTAEGQENYQQGLQAIDRYLWLSGVLVGGSLLLIITLFVKIISRMNSAISQLASTARQVADGDLTRQIQLSGNDEFSGIARYVNEIVGSFEQLASATRSSTLELAHSTEESAAVATQTRQNVLDQQQQTQQIATAIHQFTATVREVARNTASAAEASRQADQSAAEGQRVVQQSIGMIESLAKDLQAAMSAMQSLNAHADAIGSVVEVIRDISEQTNLLALNAAIEAARAGEQGRGFAVVADEVRTLAKRTQDSTQEIQQTIQNLQQGSRSTAEKMQQGTEQAQQTVTMAQQAGEALRLIRASVDEINAMNTQIATAAEEQSTVTEDISQNITGISAISDQTAAGAAQSSQATEALKKLSEMMLDTVSGYRINPQGQMQQALR